MKEETREEYLSRLRKEQGREPLDQREEEISEKKGNPIVSKLKTILFLGLLALFLWAILQIFGMMTGN